MNTREFIQSLAKKTNSTAASTQKLVESMIEEMGNVFNEGENIQFSSFGTFEVKKRMEKIITNPKTKERILVPPKLVLTFRPMASVRKNIRNKGGKKND